jgi:hypothetical protein
LKYASRSLAPLAALALGTLVFATPVSAELKKGPPQQQQVPKPFDLAISMPNPMDGTFTVTNLGPGPSTSFIVGVNCEKKNGESTPYQGCPDFPAQGPAWPPPVGSWDVVAAHGPFPSTLQVHVAPLAAGKSFHFTIPFWATLKIDPGTYTFGAVITTPDTGKTLPDSNTSNNTVTSQFTKAFPKPTIPVLKPAGAAPSN